MAMTLFFIFLWSMNYFVTYSLLSDRDFARITDKNSRYKGYMRKFKIESHTSNEKQSNVSTGNGNEVKSEGNAGSGVRSDKSMQNIPSIGNNDEISYPVAGLDSLFSKVFISAFEFNISTNSWISIYLTDLCFQSFCIIVNLESRTDKREFMNSQGHLTNCSIYTAVPPKNVATDLLRFTTRPWADILNNASISRKLGLLGMFASHLDILTRHSNSALPAILVLEDDVLVNKLALLLIQDFITSSGLDWSWDVARFYHTGFHKSGFNASHFFSDRPLLGSFRGAAIQADVFCYPAKREDADAGLHAVLYKVASIPKITRLLTSAPMSGLEDMLGVSGVSASGSPPPLSSVVCVASSPTPALFHNVGWKVRTDVPKEDTLFVFPRKRCSFEKSPPPPVAGPPETRPAWDSPEVASQVAPSPFPPLVHSTVLSR
jgi:GR25 family glycosyltransferase involved in LPS biosynthesis